MPPSTSQISHNDIYRTCRGLWLDWMAQGTRVSAQSVPRQQSEDLFVEVDHGPFVVDNNIFLSPRAFLFNSQGGAFAHNLIAGDMTGIPYDRRLTPLHKPHSTELAGMHDNPSRRPSLLQQPVRRPRRSEQVDAARLPNRMEGNVFFGGAKPAKQEDRLRSAGRISTRRSIFSRRRMAGISKSISRTNGLRGGNSSR